MTPRASLLPLLPLLLLLLATAARGLLVQVQPRPPPPDQRGARAGAGPSAGSDSAGRRLLGAGAGLHVAPAAGSRLHLVPTAVASRAAHRRRQRCSVVLHYAFSGRLGNFLFEASAAYATLRNLTARNHSACWHVQLEQQRGSLAAYWPLLRGWRAQLLGMHGERVALPALVFALNYSDFDGPRHIADHGDSDDDGSGSGGGGGNSSGALPHGMAQALAARKRVLLQLGGFAHGRWLWAQYARELHAAYAPPASAAAELRRKYPLGAAAMCYHVRGGDKARLFNHRYFVARDAYYAAALAHARSAHGGRAPGAHLVSTDDRGLVEGMPFFAALRAAGALHWIEEAPLPSLWALSLCEYGLATAASTMSWWAGFLRAMSDDDSDTGADGAARRRRRRRPTPVVMPDRLNARHSLVRHSYLAPWATVLDPRGALVQPPSSTAANRSSGALL